MKAPQVMTEFQYSRIYAQGWNAARTGTIAAKKVLPNPYSADPERSRWQEGYAAALGWNGNAAGQAEDLSVRHGS